MFGGQRGAVADALCLNAGVALAAAQVAPTAQEGIRLAQARIYLMSICDYELKYTRCSMLCVQPMQKAIVTFHALHIMFGFACLHCASCSALLVCTVLMSVLLHVNVSGFFGRLYSLYPGATYAEPFMNCSHVLAISQLQLYLHAMQEVQRSGQAGNTLQNWIDVSQQLHFADTQDAAHSA